MITTCVVLSAASDVASLKIPNLTMARILQSLAKIEGQLDIILKTPLNNAIDYFHRAVNFILTGNNKDALKIIGDLYKEATTAFSYERQDGKNMSLKSYKECAKATRLKIFATVLEASYDKTATDVPCLPDSPDRSDLAGGASGWGCIKLSVRGLSFR